MEMRRTPSNRMFLFRINEVCISKRHVLHIKRVKFYEEGRMIHRFRVQIDSNG